MMKRQGPEVLAVIVLLFVSFSATARAQDAPPLDPGLTPAEGQTEQDFLPRGWQIGTRAGGDLNGDGRTDHALQLLPEGHDSSGITAAPESHALLVLLSAEGGRLRRAGLATKLLVPVVPQYGVEMTIKNGVLVVNQNYGMTDVTDLTHRFRYDPASGRFLLIGRDTFSYHRPQGPRWPSTRVSDNYLTGVRLTTTERWLRDGKSSPTTKREQIARSRAFMEDVDEDPDN